MASIRLLCVRRAVAAAALSDRPRSRDVSPEGVPSRSAVPVFGATSHSEERLTVRLQRTTTTLSGLQAATPAQTGVGESELNIRSVAEALLVVAHVVGIKYSVPSPATVPVPADMLSSPGISRTFTCANIDCEQFRIGRFSRSIPEAFRSTRLAPRGGPSAIPFPANRSGTRTSPAWVHCCLPAVSV